MKRNNLWKYLPKREDYSKLINDDDKGKLLYTRSAEFRNFVDNWDADNPNLLGWTMGDFYRRFTAKEPTLF